MTLVGLPLMLWLKNVQLEARLLYCLVRPEAHLKGL